MVATSILYGGYPCIYLPYIKTCIIIQHTSRTSLSLLSLPLPLSEPTHYTSSIFHFKHNILSYFPLKLKEILSFFPSKNRECVWVGVQEFHTKGPNLVCSCLTLLFNFKFTLKISSNHSHYVNHALRTP